MGLLPTKAGLFVDLFLLLLVCILCAMLVAVALVRRGRVRVHAAVMRGCFALFLVGLGAFEAQVHLGAPGPPLARVPLVIHLCCAIPGLVVWVWQVATPGTARTNPAAHRRRGRVLLGLLSLTVGTGFWLYWATFV
ncbi:MAG: DUF420 domain-containing protein [Planctomycetota bacterium]|jgi:uncharacterized membrane protein